VTERIGLHTHLRPGAEEDYDRLHRDVWPQVLEAIKRVGITRWLIFRDGLDLFHYLECDDYQTAIAVLADDPSNRRWQDEVAPLMAKAHDYSGERSDRIPLIFDLDA
jgi:L-rhamnose mutarotase